MQKPTWVKVFGWLGVTGLAAGVLLIIGVTLTQGRMSATPASAGVAFSALPCFFLWTVGTLLYRSRVHRARIQAAAFSEVVARGPAPTVQPPAEDKRAAPPKFRSGPLEL